jgi:serine protease Do
MEQENSFTEDNSLQRTSEPSKVFEKDLQIYTPPVFLCDTNYRNKLTEPEPTLMKPAAVLSVITVILIFLFALYCMVARAFSLKEGFYSPDTGTTVILGLNDRPAEEKFTDESGKYTSAGICAVVGPSVVEILNFTNDTYTSPVGSGSGIIMTEDGYIVTNAHVINKGKFVKVMLHDESSHTAQIIGYDSKSDIAVIKIATQGKTLTPAEFGNSDDVVQGEQVMAIGNPGGLTGSISGGYVSGINRMIRADETGKEMNCIQTDAAISPGNSGGALVNMYGQIIGITSSKYVSSSYEGLGFAITINDAKPIIEELIANGHISGRFKVGISFYSVTPEYAAETGLPQGLLISAIDETCDIASTDLRVEDIITEVEGTPIYDYCTFTETITAKGKGAGDTVTATVVRIDENKKQTTFEISFTLMSDTSGDY